MAEDKVVILGGRGMLGTDLVQACRQSGYNVEVFDLPEFDITDIACLSSAIEQGDLIVNCAAYTDVDGAESNFDRAYDVNARAVGDLGTLAAKSKKWVLHVSTDFVFDGKLSRPYVETDTPNPVNAYGRTKLAGENFLIESKCRCCILRVQWTYGKAGNNFVAKLIGLAKKNKSLKVVDDQTGSPTATTEVAAAICRLLPQRPSGCFHFAASGYVSRFEMARFIFNQLHIPAELIACKTHDFPSPAVRPLNSSFNCGKIQALLGTIERWEQPLKLFLEQL